MCSTKFREQGMAIAFLEHLLDAEHCVRCFVSFGLKRITEPRQHYDPHVTDGKNGPKSSWSPDLYLGLVVSKATAGFTESVVEDRSRFPTLWKYLKGDRLWW